MALIENIFKVNLATGLAVGVGAIFLGPTVIQTMARVLRPAAKTVIKSGMVFYRETLGELGEMASDLVAEAKAELEEPAHGDRERAGAAPKAGAGWAAGHGPTA
jgi:hypothetical protein